MRKITREYLKNIEGDDFSKDDRVADLLRVNGLKFEQIFVGVNSISVKGGYKIGITHSIKNVRNMGLLNEGISVFITDSHWESYRKNDTYGLLYNPDIWCKILDY